MRDAPYRIRRGPLAETLSLAADAIWSNATAVARSARGEMHLGAVVEFIGIRIQVYVHESALINECLKESWD